MTSGPVERDGDPAVAGAEERIRYLEAKLRFMRRHAEALIESRDGVSSIPDAQVRLEAAEREIARLRGLNRHLEDELLRVFATVSWRVTAPLRWVRARTMRRPP